MNCLCNKERNQSYDSESNDGSDSGITEQSEFLVRCNENFNDPESGSSSGATHVPDRISTILSPRTLPRCDSGKPRDTLNGTGITRKIFFERPPAQGGLSFTIFNNSKNLASSLRPDITETARSE